MQEAEVSLRIALYYITNHLTNDDVKVSIDGAHIKTKEIVHFDIHSFLSSCNCHKIDGLIDKWQGVYEVNNQSTKLIVSSTPGIGDVNITTIDGKQLYIESKKGKEKNKSGSEYPLMREAIGQLMTGCEINENVVPIVAVPYTEKSYELACRWSQLKQIKMLGIRFMLVRDNDSMEFI